MYFLQGMCFGLRDIKLGIKRNIITRTNIYCQYNERRKSLNDQKVANYFLPFRIRPQIGASLDQIGKEGKGFLDTFVEMLLSWVIVLDVTSLNELPLLLGAALENVFWQTTNSGNFCTEKNLNEARTNIILNQRVVRLDRGWPLLSKSGRMSPFRFRYKKRNRNDKFYQENKENCKEG